MKSRKALLIFMSVFAAFIIFGCGQVNSLQKASDPIPTEAPKIKNTPIPSQTPRPAQPTVVPMPGWVKYESGDIELWLPESYVGGNVNEDLDLIVSSLRELGPNYESAAQSIEQNPDMYLIWATDSKVGSSGFITNVNATTEDVLSTISVETYLAAATAQLPAEFSVVDQKTMTMNGYEAGQMVLQFEISGVSGKELFYIFKDGSSVWTITFATGVEEYDTRLPEFEQIADSFRVIK